MHPAAFVKLEFSLTASRVALQVPSGRMSPIFLASSSFSESVKALNDFWPLLAGMFAIAAAVWRITSRQLTRMIEKTMTPHLTSLRSRLGSVEDQLKPNGGTTMRDAVNATRDSVRRVDEKVEILTERVKGLSDRVGMLEEHDHR